MVLFCLSACFGGLWKLVSARVCDQVRVWYLFLLPVLYSAGDFQERSRPAPGAPVPRRALHADRLGRLARRELAGGIHFAHHPLPARRLVRLVLMWLTDVRLNSRIRPLSEIFTHLEVDHFILERYVTSMCRTLRDREGDDCARGEMYRANFFPA